MVKRKKKVEKSRCGGLWTEARYRGFITSALRSASRRWPPKYLVLGDSYCGRQINKKSGRLAKHYLCTLCGGKFPQAQIQVDHRIPIGKCKTWDKFIESLFCEKDNLQTVCKPCHQLKSKKEASESR